MASPAASSLNTIDAILSHYAKTLKPGESISIPLYKGKNTTTSIDPIKSRTVVNATSVAARNLQEKFPKMAKFIETVEKPNLQTTFRNARLYQEDIPKAQADSDDEGDDQEVAIRKKKRRRRKRPPRQHWVLQSNEEFSRKMKIKQIKLKDPEKGAMFEAEVRSRLSNRYEGLPESNNSQYVLLSASGSAPGSVSNPQQQQEPSISVTSMHGFVSFGQPAKFKTLSMHDAENAIASKNVSRYMMHGAMKNDHNGNSNGMMNNQSKNARRRLLGMLDDKLDDDDIMNDVAFREEKAGVSIQTRQELLSDLADADIKVDHDGTLGGANDSEFAGGRRFGQMKKSVARDQKDDKREKTNDGAADDFYHQDVGAQFDNLDCDMDALFDNNDEDMGAGNQDNYDLGGFADVEDEESDVEEEDDLDLGAIATKSFATKTGMKAIFAKAKGENVDVQANLPTMSMELKGQRTHRSGNFSGSERSDDENEMGTSKRISPEPNTTSKVTDSKSISSASKAAPSSLNNANVRQVDENGLRIITKEAVRREIWLHNGTIPTTQLFKKFKAHGKKFRDRAKGLSEICLELCTMEGDDLTLKQHYAKMD